MALRVLALIVFTATVSGCGSSPEPGDATFRSRVQAVCRDLARAGSLPSGRKPSDAQMRQFARTWQESSDRLSRFQPPADETKSFDAMVDGFHDAAFAIRVLVRSNDESVLGAAAAIAVAGDRATRAARRLSLSDCVLFPELPESLRPQP
jgi:hypothetical protein